MSNAGPRSSTTRLVLLVLSTFMDIDGQRAYPSEEKIAKNAALSEKAVRTHLTIAVKQGWIERELKRSDGQKWAHYHYAATFPPGYSRLEGRSGIAIQPPEPGAQLPESHDQNHRNHVPTNSSVNSIYNSAYKKSDKGPGWSHWRTFVENKT